MTRSIKRAMKKKQQQVKQPMIQALVWYKEEDWDALMEMFPDRHLMPETFKDWLTRADELLEKIQAEGDLPIKVFIDPVTFPEWCKKKGKKLDASARTDMAIEVATAQSFGNKV